MPELKNITDQTIFVPGIDITLEPNEAAEISEAEAEAIQSPLLAIDGKSSVRAELNQVDPVAGEAAEPTSEHITQTPSEGK